MGVGVYCGKDELVAVMQSLQQMEAALSNRAIIEAVD